MKQILKIVALFILVYSCSGEKENQLYLDSDLADKSAKELRILRNEIFAKHGYIFKSEDLRKHFSQQDWYEPLYDNVDSLLTENDKLNIQLILKFENQLNIKETKVVSEPLIPINKPINLENQIINSLVDSKELIREFLSFWNDSDTSYLEYKIKVVDTFDTLLTETKYKYVKYEIKGQGKDFSATANKVALYYSKNSNYKVVFDTGIFQPECGTNDFSIKGLDLILQNDTEFTVLTYHTRIWGCCGASDVLIDSLIFLRKPNHDYFGAIEFSYVDWNNDYCSGRGDTIYRKTRLNLMVDPAEMTTVKYKGERTDSSEVLTKYLTFSGEKLQEISN